MDTSEQVLISHPSSGNSCFLPELPKKDTKGLWIFGESESKRRVILIERENGSYGFTLQSYGVRYKHGHRDTDFITYVNAVEKNGAAQQAGLREGDVILSINGQNMARVEHKSLVNFIRQCPATLKLIVVSDERARKVELHMRYVHLQKKLQDKIKELEELSFREKEILRGAFSSKSICSGPCLAAASTVCCFCPPNPVKIKEVPEISTASSSRPILVPNSDVEEAQLQYTIQQRSKSVKIPSEKEKGSNSVKGEPKYYDSYRKSTSSRDLVTNSGNVDASPAYLNHHHHHHCSEKSQMKPLSWDNLMASGKTKSFGGYGYGYGYGYFPTSRDSTSGTSSTMVTHPHHHNHCAHAQNYSSKAQKHGDESASKVKVVYNYVAPTYHTMLPNMVLMEGQNASSTSSFGTPSKKYGVPAHFDRSKTLPSSARTSTTKTPNPDEFRLNKLEKTFSDSSLSDHYKDFSKTMAYFQRAGDNVRFSSEEDFVPYGNAVRTHRKKSKSGAKDRERIFV